MWPQRSIFYLGYTFVFLSAYLQTVYAQASGTTGSISASTTPTEQLAPIGGLCGGTDYTGPTKCVEGAECVYYHATLSVCLPPKPEKEAKLGEQCAGESTEFEGVIPCESGLVCEYNSDNLYTCVQHPTQRQNLYDGELCAGIDFKERWYWYPNGPPPYPCLPHSKCEFQDIRSSFCLPPYSGLPLSAGSTCTPLTYQNYITAQRCASGLSCRNNGSTSVCTEIYANFGEQCAGPGYYMGPLVCSTNVEKNAICRYNDGDEVPVCSSPILEIPEGEQCPGDSYYSTFETSATCVSGTTCTEIDKSVSLCLPPRTSQYVPEGYGCGGERNCEPGYRCTSQKSGSTSTTFYRCTPDPCVNPKLQCFGKSWPYVKRCCSGTCKMFNNGLYGQCIED